ncbi:tRNA methyltransferase 112-like protein [Chrysochromulina tobinii]|uniref:tRNA methyltransferase 112-like protein n=1 Tax=Chrysochromulina tobinii TaxID=1460289 RepID=A0A0M0JR38_9EUKA|nr:tRNA methyltransferase 112-like protein [Chrysochromulina tobinii]|eukprot:KOO28723.1 tRNA methyltransferase 112-like protein [Chrysochromulina sp. CCMP291]
MKLLTHNMLMSPGTKNGYPLAIEVEKMETVEAEFNGEFTARMVEKLDYAALLSTLRSLSVETGLPAAVPAEYAGDEVFLKALHHALMEIEILEGYLVCPETQKKFPIREGIPSML